MKRSSVLSRYATLFLIPTVVFTVALAWILGLDIILAWLLSINLSTILAYGYDKRIAGGSKTRIPESVLHLLALLGGTPAAYVGMRQFHHKTVKGSFRSANSCVSFSNSANIVWRKMVPRTASIWRLIRKARWRSSLACCER